jgi:hypothetical protein
MKEYTKAIISFKKLLHCAWSSKSAEGERSAYDFLSIQYYYLGDLKKSKFYNDRAIRGKFEAPDSIVRNFSLNEGKNHQKDD